MSKSGKRSDMTDSARLVALAEAEDRVNKLLEKMEDDLTPTQLLSRKEHDRPQWVNAEQEVIEARTNFSQLMGDIEEKARQRSLLLRGAMGLDLAPDVFDVEDFDDGGLSMAGQRTEMDNLVDDVNEQYQRLGALLSKLGSLKRAPKDQQERIAGAVRQLKTAMNGLEDAITNKPPSLAAKKTPEARDEEMESLKVKLVILENENASLRKRLSESDADRARLTSEVAQLKAQLATLEQTLTKRFQDDLARQLEALRQKLMAQHAETLAAAQAMYEMDKMLLQQQLSEVQGELSVVEAKDSEERGVDPVFAGGDGSVSHRSMQQQQQQQGSNSGGSSGGLDRTFSDVLGRSVESSERLIGHQYGGDSGAPGSPVSRGRDGLASSFNSSSGIPTTGISAQVQPRSDGDSALLTKRSQAHSESRGGASTMRSGGSAIDWDNVALPEDNDVGRLHNRIRYLEGQLAQVLEMVRNILKANVMLHYSEIGGISGKNVLKSPPPFGTKTLSQSSLGSSPQRVVHSPPSRVHSGSPMSRQQQAEMQMLAQLLDNTLNKSPKR